MDTCVATPQHSTGLPSIGFFESNKFKRDDMDQSRRGSNNATSPSSFRFPGSYSHTTQGSSSGMISPPSSRRTSSEERVPAQPARQSLPSIHEALGRDSSLTYSGLPPPPPPPPTAASSAPVTTASYLHPPTSATAPEPPRRLFAPPEPSPVHPTSNPPSHASQVPTPASSQQHSPARSTALQGPPMFSSSQSKAPPVPPIRTGISPPTPTARTYPPSQPSSASYESGPQSAPPNPPYGYSGYHSQYQYPPSSSVGQGYPAPAVLSAPPQYPTPASWRDDREYPSAGAKSQINHKENVKRKLDQFQFDATVHEIREFGLELQKFANNCGERAYKAQNGAFHNVTSLHELDNFTSKLQAMQDTFRQLREVVAQPNSVLGVEEKRPLPMSNGYIHHDSNGYPEEPKQANLYPQQDTKKRRGRAAPPGRCHSCNRAETPEWRRGPDGARTLCNACGLHYAKLTRKMGNNSKGAISNSNLRPKALGSGGPPPPGPSPPGPSLPQ